MTTERRAHRRQGAARPCLAFILGPGERPLGLAVPEDVSAGGVRLLASRRFAAGESLALVPQFPHPLEGRAFPFRVARCEALPGGGYSLAGPFLKALAREEVRALAGG